MITVNALSEVAALMGDPTRAAMLSLLMDGRAHTASELAHTAGITAQTASGHLGRMVDGGRPFARQCLDWSERRPHISGALGAAIADTFFKRGWAERLRRSRSVRLTDSGRRALGSHFGAAV